MSGKLLTYRDLEASGHGSRVTVWRKTKDESLNFPSPIDIGYGQKRWKESEIDDWVDSRAVNQAWRPAHRGG